MKLAIVCTPAAKGYEKLIHLFNAVTCTIFHIKNAELLSAESFYIQEYESKYGYFDTIIFLDTALYMRGDYTNIYPKYNEVVSTRNITIERNWQMLSYKFFMCNSTTFHKLSYFFDFEKFNYFKGSVIENMLPSRKHLFYFYAYRLGVKKVENRGFVTRK